MTDPEKLCTDGGAPSNETNRCDGCGRTDDFVGSLVVSRRRYDNVCPDCMDILEQVLERNLVRNFDPQEDTDE